MEMKKKALSIIAMTLSASMLFACSPAEKDGVISNDAASKVSSSGESTGIYTPVGTYPVVNEKIELNVLQEQGPSIIDYETNDFTKYIEDLTNIDLVFEVAPAGSGAEKMNRLLTSGDYPDAFINSVPDEARYGVQEGILIDLTPYLDNAPNYNKFTTDIPAAKAFAPAVDGKIYALPGFIDCFHISYYAKLWMNTMQLEAMNEKVPTTTDEFYNVLKKFKAANPKNVPLIGGNGIGNFIDNSFFYYSGDQHRLRIKDNKTVETTANIPEYRESLKYLNKLYSEKLIDESAFTMSGDQMKALVASEGEPVLFSSSHASVTFVDNISIPELYNHYYPIAPLKGPNGEQNALYNPPGFYSSFAVTKACKYPEAAIRFADFFYTVEGHMESVIGRKCTDWVDAPEGSVGMDGKPAIVKGIKPYSLEPQNVSWQDAGIPYDTEEIRFGSATDIDLDIFSPEGMELMLYKSTLDLYAPYTNKVYKNPPQLKYTLEENEALATKKVEVNRYITESRTQFITGALDINNDSDWDTYIKGLDDMGMQEIIKTAQAAFNRMNS